MRLDQNRKTPTFSKIMNFGPHISTLMESPSEGLQAPQFFGGQNSETKKLLSDQILNFGPDFSKMMNFGPYF